MLDFDTLDHEILFSRLQNRFGISGRVLGWFSSYLRDRSQSVVIRNGHTSSRQYIKRGVPQGTALGPALFTLYTSPIEDIIARHGLESMIYADDIQVYIACKRPDSVTASVEECLDEIRSWMYYFSMMLKPEVMHCKSRFDDSQTIKSIRVGDEAITLSTSVRNLGVIFDSNCSMESFMSQTCKSISFALFKIGRIRRLLDMKSTEKLVHAMITSRLDYCNSLYYNMSISQFKKNSKACRMPLPK
ncbi:hypothetical protein SNE40_020781 [Patella caerulea]|uniref:Reverse transcriptase domain-containing protein n=1 Tax=Patella caerulea TaxID=87958 RepID=A0AAN8P3P6_PATCE